MGNEPSSEDALDHVDMSTDDLARQENMEAAEADQNRGSYDQRDRLEEGRSHDRSQGDRPSGRESSS